MLYAGALSLWVYREMDLKGLYTALLDTGKLSAVALFCVGTASAFGWLLAYYQIPKALLAGVSTWGMGVTATGFFIAGVFLVVGCFLDAIPAIIIVGTILQPLAMNAGMDPVHFAIVGIVALAFGLVTPPYGLCLMIACAVAKIRIVDALKDTLIMLVPMLAVLAAIIVWPSVALFLPRLFPPGTLVAMIGFEPLSALFGVETSDVDLSRPLSDARSSSSSRRSTPTRCWRCAGRTSPRRSSSPSRAASARRSRT